jgi:hypothetical protein
MTTFQALRDQSNVTTQEALSLFDQLDPVNLEFVMGRWQGSKFPTQHPLDHFIEAYNWYGKEFVDLDQVHPLVFVDNNGNRFLVDPKKIFNRQILNYEVPTNEVLKQMFLATRWLLETQESKARVRMMEYRGKVSATMIYDELPIYDSFRKVDENTMLGLMDLKGDARSFFFVLKRD